MQFLKIMSLSLGVFVLAACGHNTQVNQETMIEDNKKNDKMMSSGLEEGDYNISLGNSMIKWSGQNIVGKSHGGTIDIKSGTLKVEGEKISEGMIIVDMTSIKSDEGLDNLVSHLSSGDFFDVENFPESTLKISSVEGGLVKGSLIIKGNENPLEFEAEIKSDESGQIMISANFEIDRTLWDVRYGSDKFFENLGDSVIKDEITYEISLIANK